MGLDKHGKPSWWSTFQEYLGEIKNGKEGKLKELAVSEMLNLAHELDKVEFDYDGSRGSALKKVFVGYPIKFKED